MPLVYTLSLDFIRSMPAQRDLWSNCVPLGLLFLCSYLMVSFFLLFSQSCHYSHSSLHFFVQELLPLTYDFGGFFVIRAATSIPHPSSSCFYSWNLMPNLPFHNMDFSRGEACDRTTYHYHRSQRSSTRKNINISWVNEELTLHH